MGRDILKMKKIERMDGAEEKRIELGGLLDYRQVGQSKHESPCREAKGTRILCEEIMDENF